MTRALKTGLLTLAILLFLGLEETTEACSCFHLHPQQAFCNADFVIKAKVTGSETIYGRFGFWIKYTITNVKFFKGKYKGLDSVISTYYSAACGVNLNIGTEYLLSGSINSNGVFYISLCGFNVPWDSLTNAQRLGVKQRYRKGCECKIHYCFSQYCEIAGPKMCIWTDRYNQQQTEQSYCLLKKKNTCVWYSGPNEPSTGY